MYLRMGMVVGNADLTGTIIIVLIAHVISVTTGLAVSSIATDKKIEAGGIYYILSRSLGLPIGGAIGYTLFVGTALAIALYLVGFAESFIEVMGPEAFIDVPILDGMSDKGIVTVIATGALLFITAVAFISTSIALKAQFIILGLIVLSLFSIFMGDWSGMEVPEGTVVPDKMEGFAVFAIFFPAVTGFTAGVAMSGDLKDPKKSIPMGTIFSIATGLIIYLTLAVFIAFSIDGDLLRTDNNILKKGAMFAWMVVAGIWGATLSSAIGSLLGAPRIIQAMAVDKIAPKILGKGVGAENEPRNALILTFIIAQGGILIGELNTIAEVVSMFYLSAYGFINLAQFLESWASSDYIPSFRIPKWIGLLGFVATIIVMLKLNAIAMAVALLVIVGIFLLLTRKQIALGSGDVWQSVWSSVVKTGLKRMDRKEMHKRNWEPNILLFSGGSEHRPHLIEYSKDLAGRLGMISNFDLVEVPDSKVLFPKHQQSVKDEALQEQGIFARRQECSNVFQGIQMIASTYGFSGIEPNTVLMGWARNTSNPSAFAEMTLQLHDLDYNVLYMDYDEQRGFGKFAKIDIWWNGFSNDCELTLSLVKLMRTSLNWRNAAVRVLMVNNENDQRLAVEEHIADILDELRVKGTIKVINNAIEQKSFYDIVKTQSFDADFVVLSIPSVLEGQETEFVNATTDLVGTIGTTLLVRASSAFDEIGIDLDRVQAFSQDRNNATPFLAKQEVALGTPAFSTLEQPIVALDQEFMKLNTRFAQQTCAGMIAVYQSKSDYLQKKVESVLADADLTSNDKRMEVARLFREIASEVASKQLVSTAKEIGKGIEDLMSDQKQLVTAVAPVLIRELKEDELVVDKEDALSLKRVKRGKMMSKSFGIRPKIRLKFRELTEQRYNEVYLSAFDQQLYHLKVLGFELTFGLRGLFNTIMEQISLIDWADERAVKKLNLEVSELFQDYNKQLDDYPARMLEKVNTLSRKFVNTVLVDANRLDYKLRLDDRQAEMSSRKVKRMYLKIGTFPQGWLTHQELLHNNLLLDYQLDEVRSSVANTLRYEIEMLHHETLAPAVNELQRVETEIASLLQMIKEEKELPADRSIYRPKELLDFQHDQFIEELLQHIGGEVDHLPELMDVLDTQQHVEDMQANELKTQLKLRKLVEFVLEAQFIEDIEKDLAVIERELGRILTQADNSGKLVAFSVSNTSLSNEQLEEVVQKSLTDLGSFIERIKILEDKANRLLQSEEQRLHELLTSDILISRAGKFDKYVSREQSQRGLKSRLNRFSTAISGGYKKVVNTISSRKEKLLNAQFEIENETNRNLHAVVRDFVDSVTPSTHVQEQIPFYYKQMFDDKHLGISDKITFRARERELFEKANQRFEEGIDGGILFTGPHLSGYNSLAMELVDQLPERVFTVYRSLHKPDSDHLLADSLSAAFGKKGHLENVMEMIPQGSTILFKHLEHWYRRGEENSAFEDVLDLIRMYGHRYRFVVTCNLYFYQFIQQFTALPDVLQSTIQMSPFQIEEVKEDLLNRHQSGGIALTFLGKREEHVREKDWNRLFKHIHSLSKGNPGTAAYLWLSGIRSFKEEEITFATPMPGTLPSIRRSDWLLFLKEINLFGSLSVNEAHNMMHGTSLSEVHTVFQSLKRAGLLIEQEEERYRFNPYVAVFIADILTENYLIKA